MKSYNLVIANFIFSHNIYEHVLDNVNDLKRTMMKNTVTALKNYQYSWKPNKLD